MTEISTSLDTLQTQGDKNRKRWGMGGGNQDGATHCVSCSALCWEAEECAGGGGLRAQPSSKASLHATHVGGVHRARDNHTWMSGSFLQRRQLFVWHVHLLTHN